MRRPSARQELLLGDRAAAATQRLGIRLQQTALACEQIAQQDAVRAPHSLSMCGTDAATQARRSASNGTLSVQMWRRTLPTPTKPPWAERFEYHRPSS